METEGKRERGPDRPHGESAAPSQAGREEHARSSLREQAASAKERTREKKEEIEEKAGQKAEELKERAVRKTDEITSRVGGRIEVLAGALRRASEDMRNQGEPRFADISDRAAAGVERFGSYLETQNPHEMMSDLDQSARNHPATFVAGGFAVGLLLGRFLRSGEPEARGRASHVDDGEIDWSDAYLEDADRDPAFGEAR